MFEKWKRATREPADLNIIPVMNLFMVLIPFLLAGAAFVKYGVIPTSTPTQKSSSKTAKEKKKDEPKRVMANLVVAPDEIRLTYSSSNVPEGERESLAESWSWDGTDGAVLDELRSALRRAKDEYPESNTVTVLPHGDLQYQQLVRILDHTREYQAGTDEEGAAQYEPLFPVTVFSKYSPDESEEGENGNGGSE